MSKASYWQRGETLDYKNTGSSTIEANTVVELTGRVGIAGTDIAPGAEGDLHVCGVFEFDKTGTNEIAFGQPVYFDKTGITDAANNGETSGSNSYVSQGKCAGARIEFSEDENPVTDILNGKIQFHQYLAPYVPAEDILNILEFDPDMLSAALNGGE